MTDARAAADLLRERPDLEPAVRAALAVDADREREPWTFDDVAVDSGAFGELVARGVVERRDGGYRVVAPDAVRAALDGDAGEPTVAAPGVSASPVASHPFADVDATAILTLAGTLAFLALFRLVSFPFVFRERVVLSGNDAYYYRHWTDQLLAQSGGALDLSVLSALPPAVAAGEPLLVAALWSASALAGGASGIVLAVYPVVAAVATGLFTYLLARRTSDDRRVALAAVALLAVVPAHALRTGLGFADHHAFDYVWLALTAWAVVALVDRDSRGFAIDRSTLVAAVALGVGVAGQTLAWDNGPVLLVPVGLAVALAVPVAVREGRSPAALGAPVVAGLALAAGLSHLAHAGLGWHTDTVAYAPSLLLAGVVVALVVGEAFARLAPSVSNPALPIAPAVLGAEVVAVVGVVLVVRSRFPGFWSDLGRGLGTLFAERAIAEVQSLFASGSAGWLLLFGFALVLALPYLAWGLWRGWRGALGWLVVGTYGGYFLALAAVQTRFAGELSPFVAVFAGLGFVHLAERVDLAARPVPLRDPPERTDDREPSPRLPDRRRLGALALLFLLVGGLGMIQVPVKTSLVTVPDGQYRTATAIDAHAEERGLAYPESYVLSEWGRNRVYNYFVGGEAASYGYARANYDAFVESTTPGPWYERFRGRVGYVVVEDDARPSNVIGARLHERYGSRADGVAGLAHYRAIYASPGGEYVAFAVVPGATIVGPASGESVTVETGVEIDGASFAYERRAAVEGGTFRVTVAYPGTYSVGGETVYVSEAAVEEGRTVRVGA
ncbi:STT3 domain-containing protein [Halomarina halobia]|uniref:dolichyl-phosphooligosaccharide-protein glycotransferase n=1 Tax=Halomarina halobia TaxID=3033386 RepID=A0ABD6A982_9EURY|nr:STT3 domain-containing protein [Halomarina sp. PSR21]